MAKTRFDIPTQIPTGVTRPIYAGVGVTDRVVEIVRETVADVQKRVVAAQQDVQKTVSGFDYQPEALRTQAAKAVSARVDAINHDARTLPVRLQKLVDGQVAVAGDAYDELVKRGETLVGRIRRQPSTQATTASARTTTAKAKTTRTQSAKTAKTARSAATRTTKKAAKSPARSSAKATATAAKTTAANAAQATTDAASKVGD
jgi:heparin binding hemagglutinin HbhA